MPKCWRILPHDRVLVELIERSAGVSAVAATLLAERGLTDPPSVRSFLGGTVADVVPLLDESRTYVKHGLECLRKRGGPGIERLLELAKLHEKSQLDSEDIAFRLAPRLNAAGRLSQAACGIELLTTCDAALAVQLADYVHELNARRETEERSIQLAASKQAKEQFDPDSDPALVLADRGWHAGVIGIVAGRLAERWHRPIVMISRDEHQGRPAIGSVRSVPGFDVHEALMACREHLLTCGGHAAAVGLRIEEGKIEDSRRAFLAAVGERMPASLRLPQITLDGEATLAGLTLDTVQQLERLAPFGQGIRRGGSRRCGFEESSSRHLFPPREQRN